MSPLDHELRAALTSRAVTLTPAADPLAGIEARAGQLRRRKLAGTLAGTALAVALVAVGVPVALGSSPVPPSPGLAATSPAPAPSASPAAVDPFVLDPDDPWELRGDADLVEQEVLQEWYALVHGSGWTVTPLWAQVYEPSAWPEVAYVAVRGDEVRWGVVQGPNPFARSVFSPTYFRSLRDLPLAPATRALTTALPGDEAPRLLVIAAPQVETLRYTTDGKATGDREMDTSGARGVGLTVLDGDPAADRVAVLRPVRPGELISVCKPVGWLCPYGVLFEGPAPDPVEAPAASSPPTTRPTTEATTRPATASPKSPPSSPSPQPSAPPPTTAPPPTPVAPTNLLGWPARGTVPAKADLTSARAAYATTLGRADEADDVSLEVLFGGDLDGGTRFLVGQAWLPGEPARAIGWASPTEAGELVQVGPATPVGTVVLGFLLPGSTTDTLVVVPQPRTGQVEYGENDATEFQPVGVNSTDGVVLIDRSPSATTDQLRLLDGNGDLDNPTFQGPVSSLLCGVGGCS